MKIAYISVLKHENFALYPNCHDGGGCFAKYAKELLNNEQDEFCIFAQEENFKNFSDEDKKVNHILTEREVHYLRNGGQLASVIPTLSEFDIICHGDGDFFAYNMAGLKAKQVVWIGFVNQTVHPANHAVLYYHHTQNFRYNPQTTKPYKVVIGKYVDPIFTPCTKKDFVFSCVRNDFLTNTSRVADLCNKFNITGFFAGPIREDKDGSEYQFKKHIDNKNTFYLGSISEKEKLKLSREARLYNCVQEWDTIFSQSAIEGLGNNTPLIAYKRGCFEYLIEDGVDGFYFDGTDENFLDIWNKSKEINQRKCWEKARQYSHEEMVRVFRNSFEDILGK